MRTAALKQGRMSSSLLAAAMCLSVIAGQASGRVITVRLGWEPDPNEPNAALRTPSGGGNDDAEEHLDDNRMDLGSSDLELGEDGSGDFQLVGMRFVNVDLPQGVTIVDARIQFSVDEPDSRETNLTITGEATDDASVFANTSANISSRARTAASAAWNDVPAWPSQPSGRVSEDHVTSNFASVVQEIVDRPGWAAGNAMVIIIEGTGERTAGSWNGEQNAAPILIVTTTGGPHAKVVFRRIIHANDEVEISGSGTNKGSSSDLELGTGDSNAGIGLRWLDLPIPQGSTITEAYIQFERDEDQSGQIDLIISGELSPNAARYTDTENIFNDRPLTQGIDPNDPTPGFVEWLNIPPWSGDEEAQLAERTPNIAELIEEIVGQPGWVAGNALAVIIEGEGHRTAESQSSDSDAAALIEIHYTPPQGFSPDPIVAAQIDDPLTVDLAIPDTCNLTEDVTYAVSSADASVASVAGTITFVADGPPFALADVEFTYAGTDIGTTTLTASRVGGATTDCPDITVDVQVVAAQSVDLQPLDQMQIANQQQMVVIGDFLAAGTREFAAAENTTYAVEIIDDPDGLGVVEIGPGGIITAISLGTVRITATNNNHSDSELLDVVAGASQTISVRISNGLDDAEEHIIGKEGIVGFMEDPPNHTSSDMELGEEGSGDFQIVGLRFLNIDIPPGAVIEAAHIQFKIDESDSSAANFRIFGAPEPDAGPICGEPFCLSTRGETAASVEWLNVPPWTEIGLIGPDQRTSNFAVVVQEIIDLPGWAAGNTMLIMIVGSGERTAEAFNGDAAGAPLLEITFTLEAGFSPAPILIAEVDPSPQTVGLTVLPGCNLRDDQTYTISSDNLSVVGPAPPGTVTFPSSGDVSQPVDLEVNGAGTATLTATPPPGAPSSCEDFTASVEVIAIQAVDLQLPFRGLEPGDTVQATVVGDFGAAGLRDLTVAATGTTYVADPPGIVEISPDGLITALAPGTVQVTATNGPSGLATIVVADQITKIAFIAGKLELNDADQAAARHLASLTFSGDPGQLDPAGLPAQVVIIDDDFIDEDRIEADFDLLVISSTADASEVGGKFRCRNNPVLFWNSGLHAPNREGMASAGDTRRPGMGDTQLLDCPRGIFVTDSSHPITQGLTLDTCLAVYNEDQTQSVAFTGPQAAGTLAGGARVLAEAEFVDNATIVVAGPAGDSDIPGGDGLRAGGTGTFLSRHVFLWLHDDTFGDLNATGLDIFERSVNWALAGTREALVLDSLQLFASRTEFCPPGLTFGGSGVTQLRLIGAAQAGCEANLTNASTGTTYVSSDQGVATVDASGLVTSVAEGVTTVTATNGGLSTTLELTVTPAARQPGFIVEMWGPGASPQLGSFQAALDHIAANPPGAPGSDFLGAQEGVSVINYLDDAGAGNFGNDLPFPFLAQQGGNDDFVMLATGFFFFETTDSVTFRVNSDDGYSLIIDGQVVMQEDHIAPPADLCNCVYTPPRTGFVPFEFMFFERGGGAEVEFSQLIPGVGGENVLINDPNDPRALRAFQSVPCLPDEPTGPAPELVQIASGLGSAPDRFISPLGETVPFTTVDLDLTADVEFASPQPGFTLTANGGGNHTLTSDAAVPVGTCLTLSFDVRDLDTGVVGTITFTMCHLPLDVNQDGIVNIQDITAWGAEFNGARRAALVDTNGDGNVNVQDATRVGDTWFGRPPATKPWNGEALP